MFTRHNKRRALLYVYDEPKHGSVSPVYRRDKKRFKESLNQKEFNIDPKRAYIDYFGI